VHVEAHRWPWRRRLWEWRGIGNRPSVLVHELYGNCTETRPLCLYGDPFPVLRIGCRAKILRELASALACVEDFAHFVGDRLEGKGLLNERHAVNSGRVARRCAG